jgi:hypothetical protein
MHNIALLEESYRKFIKEIATWAPESIIDVNLELLQEFNLLHFHGKPTQDPALTRYFQVVESTEKITLVNDDFVVWIVPEKTENMALTYTIISLNDNDHPSLELVFVTAGVYNTSRLVLRVLEKFLFEIQENEEMLKRIKKQT